MADNDMEISVPGSVSNLGPGFDALAVAVDLFLRIRIVERDDAALDTLVTEFVGAGPAGANRIEEAFTLARARCGIPTPGVRIQVRSDIPARAGLGSSAAAAVAGFRLYQAVAGEQVNGTDWLALATEMEGHPDNAAAALLGGLTLSVQREDGRVIARSARWPAAVRFVVATPNLGVETPKARAVLPSTIALRDAVFNLQRALLLLHALESGDFREVREALRDRWHQPVRAALVPGLTEALTIDDPAVLGVCLSGSGPSIVALVTDGAARATALFEDIYREVGLSCTIRTLSAHQSPADAGDGPANAGNVRLKPATVRLTPDPTKYFGSVRL
jgi:homoserine kinase